MLGSKELLHCILLTDKLEVVVKESCLLVDKLLISVSLLEIFVALVEMLVPKEFNCVCTADVTASKYPSSVDVTALTATLPLELETKALLAVRLLPVIVVAPPVIVACLPSMEVLSVAILVSISVSV